MANKTATFQEISDHAALKQYAMAAGYQMRSDEYAQIALDLKLIGFQLSCEQPEELKALILRYRDVYMLYADDTAGYGQDLDKAQQALFDYCAMMDGTQLGETWQIAQYYLNSATTLGLEGFGKE